MIRHTFHIPFHCIKREKNEKLKQFQILEFPVAEIHAHYRRAHTHTLMFAIETNKQKKWKQRILLQLKIVIWFRFVSFHFTSYLSHFIFYAACIHWNNKQPKTAFSILSPCGSFDMENVFDKLQILCIRNFFRKWNKLEKWHVPSFSSLFVSDEFVWVCRNGNVWQLVLPIMCDLFTRTSHTRNQMGHLFMHENINKPFDLKAFHFQTEGIREATELCNSTLNRIFQWIFNFESRLNPSNSICFIARFSNRKHQSSKCVWIKSKC